MSVERWQEVQDARVAFEARWRPSQLACVDRELYDRFQEQLDHWNEAYAVGDGEDIEIHSAGMIRAQKGFNS